MVARASWYVSQGLGRHFEGRPPGLLPFCPKVTTRSIKGLS